MIIWVNLGPIFSPGSLCSVLAYGNFGCIFWGRICMLYGMKHVYEAFKVFLQHLCVLLYVYKWHKYYDCFVALSARNCAPTHVRPHKPLPEFLSGLFFFFSSLCFSIIFFFAQKTLKPNREPCGVTV